MIRTRPLSLVAAVGAAMLLAACQGPPAPVPQSPVRASMHTHFALAKDLRSFAVRGWLDTLRLTASQLAATEEPWGLPPGAEVFVTRIHEAAGRAARAPDLETAIPAVAQLSQECGACHVAHDVDLGQRFRIVEPLADGSLARHMNRLAWASRLLWDGLVGPSDRTWRAGAGALAAVEGLPEAGAGALSRSEMARSEMARFEMAPAEERLRSLGEAALGADAPAPRVALLTEVWLVCADCHGRAGVGLEGALPVSPR